jgi:hypothetical protein
MSLQFSDAVKELIAKARIVSFAAWEPTYAADVIARFQAADDDRRYLTDEDLQQIAADQDSPDTKTLINIAQQLRDQATEIVDEARSQVLTQFPGITEPGGGLHPSPRAEACWRDFWHFLRCITYGITGGQTQYTSPAGLDAMQLLYRELKVPLEAMVVGLEGIKAASLKRIEASQQLQISPYFDHLIIKMRSFTA